MSVAILATAGLLAAACGGSPTVNPYSAAKIVPAVEAAMKAATSVHMVATGKSGSQQMTFDVSLQGGGSSGTVSAGRLTFDLLVLSKQTYWKVNNALLILNGLPASDCSSMCGKYVAAPTPQLGFASLTMSGLMKEMLSKMRPMTNDTSDVFVPATLNGQAVLKGGGDGVTVEVAASSPHYPLLISFSGQGTFRFSEWNSVPPLKPPPASDVIPDVMPA